MAYESKILADSVGPNGVRITTIQSTFWREMLAEFNTHRLFSRNSASSRAIPTSKTLAMPTAHPIFWGKNQPGMSSAEELSVDDIEITRQEWDELAEITRSYVKIWTARGLAKAIANRPLEWFGEHTVIFTATEFENFLYLRAPTDGPPDPNFPAQMEFQLPATQIRDLLRTSEPRVLAQGEWHRPLIDFDDEVNALPEINTFREGYEKVAEALNKISVGRCARVSYLTHDGKRDHAEDIKLHDRLLASGHLSPFEHVAQALPAGNVGWSGNFRGWLQYRETVDKTFTKVGR